MDDNETVVLRLPGTCGWETASRAESAFPRVSTTAWRADDLGRLAGWLARHVGLTDHTMLSALSALRALEPDAALVFARGVPPRTPRAEAACPRAAFHRWLPRLDGPGIVCMHCAAGERREGATMESDAMDSTEVVRGSDGWIFDGSGPWTDSVFNDRVGAIARTYGHAAHAVAATLRAMAVGEALTFRPGGELPGARLGYEASPGAVLRMPTHDAVAQARLAHVNATAKAPDPARAAWKQTVAELGAALDAPTPAVESPTLGPSPALAGHLAEPWVVHRPAPESCAKCGGEIGVRPWMADRSRYCSVACLSAAQAPAAFVRARGDTFEVYAEMAPRAAPMPLARALAWAESRRTHGPGEPRWIAAVTALRDVLDDAGEDHDPAAAPCTHAGALDALAAAAERAIRTRGGEALVTVARVMAAVEACDALERAWAAGECPK